MIEDEWNWSTTANMKVCFVTTGATATFTQLIDAVLADSAIDALRKAGYTHLLVQYGTAREVFEKAAAKAQARLDAETEAEARNHSKEGAAARDEASAQRQLVIGGLDFGPQALRPQFELVAQSQGMVVAHAGSGTILSTLRYGVPLVVVPNTELLDNHQEDLAVAMERQEYLIRGDVKDLGRAIAKSEGFRQRMTQFPPMTSGKHRETKSFAALMDETLGFE